MLMLLGDLAVHISRSTPWQERVRAELLFLIDVESFS